MSIQNTGVRQAPRAYVSLITVPFSSDARLTRAVRVGTRICDLLPPEASLVPTMVRYNGQWILRRDWLVPLAPDDHMEIHMYPQGDNSDTLATIATIIVIIVAQAYGVPVGELFLGAGASGAGAFGSALITLAGSLLINAIFKPKQPGFGNGPASSNAYDVALSGNQARLNQPIPVLYGYNRTFPDFAAQPYQEFDDNSDQYYFAIMCLGQGEYDIHAIEIDDTDISHFIDVEKNVLKPGVDRSLVRANVVTAVEVTGQELKSGKFIGPFSICAPTLTAAAIGIDVVFGGLGAAGEDGSIGSKTVSVKFEIREIDDFGAPVGTWAALAEESITASTTNPVRKSFKYSINPPRRLEIRGVRVDLKDDNSRVLNTPFWSGLRAYLQQTATLCLTATHIEVKIRASEQLSGLSQRKIAVRSTRKLPIWDGEAWSEPTPTRSIAWALADKWRSTIYGDALPEKYLGLENLLDYDEIWAARQDRFDFIFDTRITSFEADQLIAGAGRSAIIRRQGTVRTIIRDQAQYAILAGYPSNSIRTGSYTASYALANEDTTDGVLIEYWDNRLFDYREIECPAPGVAEMTKPFRFRLYGVTGRIHATREGRFIAAASFYRRKSVTFSTELLGMLPTYGSLIKIAPVAGGWGTSGFVIDWDESSKILTVSEPLVFTEVTPYLSLQRNNGTWTGAAIVSPGSSDTQLILEELPDFTITSDSGVQEPTKFVFGGLAGIGENIVVRSMRPSGKDDNGAVVIELSGIAENEAVHLVDNDLLPSDDEVQDPISPGSVVPTDPSGGTILVVSITDHTFQDHINTESVGLGLGDLDHYTNLSLRITTRGILEYKLSDASPWVVIPREWSLYNEIEPALTAQTEVIANQTLVSLAGGLPIQTGTHLSADSDAVNTWLPMTQDRIWSLSPNEHNEDGLMNTSGIEYWYGWVASLTLTFRNAATETNLDSGTITLLKTETYLRDSTGGDGTGGESGNDGDGTAGDG